MATDCRMLNIIYFILYYTSVQTSQQDHANATPLAIRKSKYVLLVDGMDLGDEGALWK